MDLAAVKASKSLKLKPNGVFVDPEMPYQYQRKGSLVMLMTPRMVLGDDVGLGKTLETLLATSYMKAQNQTTKFLVFTEKTALKQWRKEAAKLCPGYSTRIITAELYPDTAQRIRVMRNPEVDVVFTSYSMLYKFAKYLKEGMGTRWICIFDEPDLFKNTESQAHTIAFEMVNTEGGPARVYGLTATIVGNRLTEAFGILRVVCPGAIESWKYFEDNFCVTAKINNKKIIKGYKNLNDFRKLIEPVFYGRMQDDPEVMQDLPEVITKDVEITLSKEQSKKVVEAMDRLICMPDGEVKALGLLPGLTMAQQMVDDPRLKGFDIPGEKTSALLEMVNGSLNGQRIVIFSKYRSVVDLLERELRKSTNYPVLRITGAESWEEKEAAKDYFMSDEEAAEHSILLLTNAGKRAINLQKGGHFIFFDLPWAYDDYRQLIGRLKRTGSTFKVIGVYRFLAQLHPFFAANIGTDQTVDHHTLNILMRKYELFKAVTGESQANSIESGDGELKEIYEEIKSSYRVAA
jgi:SNF2 family DNA or RNA helicase